MKVTVGIAPDSWGVWFANDPKQIPWQRCLDEVVDAGYQWTELGPYGYLPTEPIALRSELNRRGLKACASAVMGNLENPSAWAQLEHEVLSAGELLAALDAEFLVLIDDTYSDLFNGKRVTATRLDDEAWKRLVDTTQKVADLVRGRFGLTLVYHPHAETHVEYEDQIERLLDETEPGRVSLCLDTGHHAYRGGEPVSFMRRYHSRIPYLHLKSVDQQKRDQVQKDNIPFAVAVAEGVFCEPSLGMVDFSAFLKVLREIDYEGYAIVEQDMYPAPFDKPLPIARRTRAYLREIGMG
jgi:inosose dehydratase